MKINRIILALVILAVLFGSYKLMSKPNASKEHGMTLTHNEIAGPAYLKVDAKELKGTIVTPHLEQKIVPDKNILWCSTFQLAWNELMTLGEGPVTLEPYSPAADILNKKTATKDDLDDASYVAMAGFIEDGAIDKIKQELNRKFNGQESPDLLNNAPAAGFIAYGYLFKSLPFEWAFDRFSEDLEFQDKPVESFGIQQYLPDEDLMEARQGKQVSIIDARDNDDFIIELKTLQVNDRLILAKVPPESTLQKTVHMVQERMQHAEPLELSESVDMYIPVLDFDLLKSYSEVQGRTIKSTNKRLNGQPIEIALQSIRFRLDETGAVLKSEGVIVCSASRINLVFDKPFLVLLQRKDAKNPYMAVWIGNTELLLPSGTRSPYKQTTEK
ncbi:MAG: hypothetical protein ACYC27_13895 [Armatimonadota bacterium]